MEYDIRDVVHVTGVKGEGFYGVVAGRTLLPSGHLDYDVVPLNGGKGVWRIVGARLRPSDRGFPEAEVAAALAAFARDRKLPIKLYLNAQAYSKLLRGNKIDIEGHRIAFAPQKLGVPTASVNFDRILGIYWASPK